MNDFNITANTGRSYEITNCQLCNSEKLNRVFFLAFILLSMTSNHLMNQRTVLKVFH